jgi:hypothetical protein
MDFRSISFVTHYSRSIDFFDVEVTTSITLRSTI